jgi:methionyl-tRNA formyltransferase
MLEDNTIEINFVVLRYNSEDRRIKQLAEEHNIPVFSHKNINEPDFLRQLKYYKSDLFVSMSFNQIFKKDIINLPPLKIINCHAGKLPFYRGRNVLNWVLINDEKEFGITVHYVDEGIDTGDIILQRTYPISDKDNYATLLEKAYIECANLLYDAIIMLKQGNVNVKKQPEIHPVGFYCSQRKVGDERLNWNQTSREIFNFVRAICKPGPIARTTLNNKEMKINKVELIDNAPDYKCITGAILEKTKDYFIVKTKDNFIKIVEFEYEGTFKVGDRFDI